MSRMDEAMQELVDAIKFSEEYIRYQDIKNRVHNQPQLEQQIHAFRHKNYLLQNSDGNVDLYVKRYIFVTVHWQYPAKRVAVNSNIFSYRHDIV